MTSLRTASQDYYYPLSSGDAWETVSPASLGWNEDAIADTIQYLGECKSIGFIILYKGRIAVEKLWGQTDIHTRKPIASSAKSMTSILIGISQEQGCLKIEDRISKYLGTGWSKAPPEKEDLITVRHLLTMTSGLTESYIDDSRNLLYEEDAGTKWFYNTPAYWKLFEVLRAATGKTVTDYTREVLWSVIGMKDTVYIDTRIAAAAAFGLLTGKKDASAIDQSGEISGDGLPTTISCSTRDMARFGLMILGNGTWAGQDVIQDKKFLNDSVNTSQQLNPSYGYLWWLNGKDSFVLPAVPGNPEGSLPGPLIRTAPLDAFAALGFGDKKIYIIPSMDLVVCRHGDSAEVQRMAASSFDINLWKKLIKVFPQT